MNIIETFNPIFWIFVSYSFGVLGTLLFKSIGLFQWFENHNYIGDKLTKRLGVLALGWLIRKSFMGKFNQKLYLKGEWNRHILEQLKKDMTDAESGHLIAFILLQIMIVFLFFWGIAFWQIVAYTVFNIIFNLYLVFLQQYNKRRIDRVLNAFHSRTTSKKAS